jgi:hypothetical protein
MAWNREIKKPNSLSYSARNMNAYNTGGKSLTNSNLSYPVSTNNYWGKMPDVTKKDPNPTGGGTGGNSKALAALMSAYQYNPYQDYLSQRQGAAKQAYDNGMAALNEAYGAYMAALEENFGSTQGQLADSYNRSKKNIQDDATQSLKQAYINKMLQAKNFDQEMSAQGISGGASETTRASMSNNYGNARNNIYTTRNRSLSDLEGNYNDNLAAATQAYNQAVAQAQLAKAEQAMQLENALANNQIAALDDYYSLVKDSEGQMNGAFAAAIGNGQNFTFDPTEVLNNYTAPEVLQADTMDQRSWANLMQALQAIMAQQGNGNVNLANPALNNNYLAAILQQLGGAR